MPTVQRWTDIGNDPNSPAVLAWRRGRLRSAYQPPVRDRVPYLTSLAEGRDVLDVGPVAHTLDRHARDEWLHKRLARVADRCLGVDILPGEVARLQEAGYDIRVCNVLDPDDRRSLEGGYEVMMCGELIEHLDNPGALMEAARDLLGPGGRLVLTTPNPFYVWGVGRHALHRPNDSADHVTFCFPSGIAELGDRHGMVLDAYRGSMIPNLTWKHYAAFRVGRTLRRVLSPEIFCTTMIYELVRPADAT
jgi:SAM-dependent methyltransferase